MEPETLRTYVSENRELEKELTKRNQQYIFDLKKSLDAANLSEEEKTIALHEMLPVLVKEQKGGKTARQLFGTVSERTEAILSAPAEKEESSPVLMWLDNTLLLLGLFSVMIGLMSFIAKGQGQSYGMLALLLAAMVGGWVFYLMYKYIYQYERKGADKSQRPKLWKTILLLVPSFLLWIIVFSSSPLLPKAINPVLDPIITIVIGAAAFGLRYYLKKKYHIVGSLSVPRN
ncbi:MULTISPECIES: DUF1129 domain-containing protein [Enterococcus]|uniref:DUF1129 domain-containing protein n=1 Tax=Enterococcus TaxID=1350 RepID=UPI00065E813C|nr:MULTISPECIES: DUF1129 domain-containing protein [Enterococcus]KAF1302677.1 hypothetical protein BAU16_06445 [Enterococcus sp. JM9B]